MNNNGKQREGAFSMGDDINDNKASLVEDICNDLHNDGYDVEIVCESEDYAIVEEERVGKKYKLVVNYRDRNALIQANPRLAIFDNRGIKFGDYIELLFDYETMLHYAPEDFVFDIFTIDNVVVQVCNPSLLFDVSMNGFSHDKYYESESCYTISLKGITEDNYEEYLNKALFLIGYYNPSTIDERYPRCFEFLGEYYYKYAEDEDEIESRRGLSKEYQGLAFHNIKHHEALAFYNEGKRLFGHEISFQYFYKVLEHFFLICRQDEFKKIINDYNSNNNINEFISNVNDIYRQNEDRQLYVLLKTVESEISQIIGEGHAKGYVADNNVESFTEALYTYRNTIVHGKSDEKFSVKIPSNIGSECENYWNMAAEKIAEKLIMHYCIN